MLRRRFRTWYAVASFRREDAVGLEPLALAVTGQRRGAIAGRVPKLDAQWAEAAAIDLDIRDRRAYLMLRPTLWITPLAMREAASDFMRARQLKRYNTQANAILNAWIQVLLGSVGPENCTVTAFADADQPASFTIHARTAYSRRETLHVG